MQQVFGGPGRLENPGNWLQRIMNREQGPRAEHLRRLDVKPGLTGLWQVTARRDPSFDTNMALDLEYIENWSLWLDLKIALKTFPAVLRAEGN